MNKKLIMILSLIAVSTKFIHTSFDIRRYICCYKPKQEDYVWTEEDGTETIVTFTENPSYKKNSKNSTENRQNSIEVDLKIIHKNQPPCQINKHKEIVRNYDASAYNNSHDDFSHHNPMHYLHAKKKRQSNL